MKVATPLMIAAAHGRLSEVEELVEAGADIDAIDEVLHAPALASAIGNGHIKVVRYLLERGASVDPVGNNASLRSALYQAEEEAVALLLGKCADPNRKTKYGRWPLEVAIRQFPVYSNYDGSESSLASEQAYLSIIQRLLDAGGRPDAMPKEVPSYTALVEAKLGGADVRPHYAEPKKKILAMLAAAKLGP